MVDTFVIPLFKIVILLNALLLAVTYMVLLERKVIAWVQVRLGPMRVGPHGVLQPIADAIKLMIKEDITPASADKWVFTAAPIIVLVPALIVFAVIPFGDHVSLFGRPSRCTSPTSTSACCTSISVASIGVYGIILGGWASNSKYPLLASLRASAQLISYESCRHDDAGQHDHDGRHAEHGGDRRRAAGAPDCGSSSCSPWRS